MNFEAIGGRRFLLVVGVWLMSSLLLYLARLDATNYAAILSWTVGAFIAGNVAQRHVEQRAKDGAAPKDPTP